MTEPGAAPPLCSFSIHYSPKACVHCVVRSLQQIKIAVGAEVVNAAAEPTLQKKRSSFLSSRGRVLRRVRREAEGGDFDDFGAENGDG